jgi:hypothetical protein
VASSGSVIEEKKSARIVHHKKIEAEVESSRTWGGMVTSFLVEKKKKIPRFDGHGF